MIVTLSVSVRVRDPHRVTVLANECLIVTESNAMLKLKFQKLHQTVVTNVNPASIVDFLFQEAVIGVDDMQAVQETREGARQQCRKLLTLLHLVTEQLVSNAHAWFVVDDTDTADTEVLCMRLPVEVTTPPRSPTKNQLHEGKDDEDAGVLIASGSEAISETPRKDITPLEGAAGKGHTEVVKRPEDNTAATDEGVTSLNSAASNGNTEVVTVVNANADNDGDTPLHRAAWNGHTELVKMLLETKADVNARKRDGATPLYIASMRGHTEIVKLLLDNKADVNIGLTNGDTPLHTAVWNGHPEVVKILLEKKADVNASKHDGATPLDIAAITGNTEIMKLLLNKQLM